MNNILTSLKEKVKNLFIYQKCIRINPNPFDRVTQYNDYVYFCKCGESNFDNICEEIILSKYQKWVWSTITNKVSTARKVLTINNKLEEDRKEILECIIRRRLNTILSKCNDIPKSLRNLSEYSSYTIDSYHLWSHYKTLPLYNENNYFMKNVTSTLLFFSKQYFKGLYYPTTTLDGSRMMIIEIKGCKGLKKVHMRLFNRNYFYNDINKDEFIKEQEEDQINYINDFTSKDISYLNHNNFDYDLRLLQEEFKYYLDINIRHIYTLTKDNIIFISQSEELN